MNLHRRIGSLLIGSALGAMGPVQPSLAQVVPDQTLPVGERSQVLGDRNFQVDGGAQRGDNLFHSFSEFSVPTGGSLYFNNAADVQTIFSRVTGGSASNIDGLIQANGTANLFLLNPNGILFGPNGALDIGGSFVATTANAIGFPNGEVFSSDATQPLPSQLLTVNSNAFFFNQLNPQPIINQSITNGTGLQVSPRQNLMLVGGPVQLENGRLTSPDSYVELGAVGGVGTVGLTTTGEDWQLAIPDSVPRADVFLRNGGQIDLSRPASARAVNGIIVSGDSGSIRILGRNIDLLGSSLSLEIPSTSTSPNATTGGVELDATGSISFNESVLANRLFSQGTTGSITLTTGDRITFENKSLLYNTIDYGGGGRTGDINITAESLSITDGSQLISGTRGPANTGSVNINIRDSVLIDGGNSGIYNIVDTTGIGNASGIYITTGSLSLTRGGALYSYTNGQGDGGNVSINARDTILMDGGIDNGVGTVGSSGIFTSVSPPLVSQGIDASQPGAVGQGGNVTLSTGSLFLTNGGSIQTNNESGTGNSGRVTINARDSVQIRGITPTLTVSRSGIVTSVSSGAVGSGGNVIITTGSLAVAAQGRINANAQGQGIAGNIQIQASGAVLFDGGDAISTLDPGGVGRGGNIEIEARSLSVLNNAQLSASTFGDGDAGNITTSADTVNLSNGGQLLTTTFSNGQAGNITVNTPDLQLFGATTGLFAQTTTAAAAGNLTIQPRQNGQNVRVNLQDGAQISASTSSSGRGGTLTITAPDSIALTGNGSVIAAETGGTGTGGNLILTAGDLLIQDQAEVSVSSSDTGSAGSLFVDADRIFLDNGGRIRADTSGGGGNINLRSPQILLRNGSNITTNASGGNIPGGNVAIDTQFLIAVPTEDSDISANSEDFRGGNINVNALATFGIEPRLVPTPLSDITATGASSALNGAIAITTPSTDPVSGLVELPTNLVDASQQIAQGCPANQGNSFVTSGRGGLPPTPAQQLDDDAGWQDRRRVSTEAQPSTTQPTTSSQWRSPPSTPPLIEATEWQTTPTGAIKLVAASANSAPLNQSAACQGSQ